jgi:predicted hydrocarbon binding protein
MKKSPAPVATFTREQWLEAAVQAVAQATPSVTFPPVKVSCSWPGGGSARKRIGECWARKMSQAGVNEIFISPKIEDSTRAVSILMHELAHAVDDCKSGHKAGFVKIAKSIGCVGKPTQMEPPVEVASAIAKVVSDKHGAYPHRGLDLSSRKKQSTRMIKCECGHCSAVWRMAAKTIAQVEGEMSCPVCHAEDGVAFG